MDYKYTYQGILSIVFGVVLVIFHNNIGDYTTKFREKLMEVSYDESIWKFNRIGFLVLGVFSTIFGILVLFHLLKLK